MRRRLGDPDETILGEQPPDFRDPDEPSPDEEPEGDEEEHDERRGGARLERTLFRLPVPVPCAVCGRVCGGEGNDDVLAICPRHLPSDAGCEPRLRHCGEMGHGGPNDDTCVWLVGWQVRCDLEFCSKRLYCERDLRIVHATCLGPLADAKGCVEGCGRSRAFRSTRCRPCQRSHLRDGARLRQSRRRARLQGIGGRGRKRDEWSRNR